MEDTKNLNSNSGDLEEDLISNAATTTSILSADEKDRHSVCEANSATDPSGMSVIYVNMNVKVIVCDCGKAYKIPSASSSPNKAVGHCHKNAIELKTDNDAEEITHTRY